MSSVAGVMTEHSTELVETTFATGHRWRAGCLRIDRRIADEGRLAPPWTVDEAADLLWNQMYPDVLERLTGERGWTVERYRGLVTAQLLRTLVLPADPR
jgi:hypothetical protein